MLYKSEPLPEHHNMIDELVDDMENWDLDSLLAFAKDYRRELLNHACISDIVEEYKEIFGEANVL